MTIPRLFIDVDGTLYDFDYQPNEPLIKAIEKYAKAFPTALIVVWSGGGKFNAQQAIDKLLPKIDAIALDKKGSFGLVEEGDIVVDDWAESLRVPKNCKILNPQEAPEVILATRERM